jgi:hypothetical protein
VGDPLQRPAFADQLRPVARTLVRTIALAIIVMLGQLPDQWDRLGEMPAHPRHQSIRLDQAPMIPLPGLSQVSQ